MKETPIIFTAESIRAILEGRKTQTRRVIDFTKARGLGGVSRGCFGADGYDTVTEKDIVRVPWTAGHISALLRCPYGEPGDRLWVKEAMFRSECGRYLALPGNRGAGNFEAWTADGSTHWLDDDRVKTWADQKKFRHPLAYVVGGYSAQTTGQKKGSFTLNLLHCDTTKEVEPFTGNTVIESRDIVFRRKTAFMPRWASRLALEITEVRAQRVQEISEEDVYAEGLYTTDGCHLSVCGGSGFHPDQWCRCGENSGQEEYAKLWDSINAKRGFPWANNPWVLALSLKQVPR